MQIAKDTEKFNAAYRLSPVLMIIFHHGETFFTGPTNVSDVYHKIEGMEEFLPQHKAILYDLSQIPESELPDDPNVPELGVVLRIMQIIFQIDIATKSLDVLEKLRPYSEQPKYRRIIRFLWVYMLNSARRMKKQNLEKITEAIKSVIGGKKMTEMTSILEDMIAEGRAIGEAWGEARGEARGKRNAIARILRVRLHLQSVPNRITSRLLEIGDLIVLDSLTELAAVCETLEEFESAL